MRQLRSELLKLRTTRTVAVLLLAAAAITLLGACVEALSPARGELAGEEAQRATFNAAGSTVVFLATLAGLISVTGEFRYGTIRPTLLFEPRRRVVLAGKVVAAALTGLLFAVVCVAVAFAAGLAILAVRDVDPALSAEHAAVLVVGPLVASPLGALLGVAVGTLIRNQVGAIAALLVYGMLVDAMLFAAVPSAGRWLPGKAGDALTGRPVDDLLGPGAGAAVLLAWTAALLVAATVRSDRTDV
jgi:ABC-type transport system involved in multi-copper enzyme maturation permease subunit